MYTYKYMHKSVRANGWSITYIYTHIQSKRVFITNVKGTFLGMSESEEASKRR